MKPVYKTDIKNAKLLNCGKVRDIYDAGDKILIVSTDRISAFDVIMNQPVPGKGTILNQISKHWFSVTKSIIDNHFISSNPEEYPEEFSSSQEQLSGRSMLVQKCKPLPVEFIVRGYITGSGWKEYQKTGKICDIELPGELVEFQKLPEPVFTPSTKAESGHDENINFENTIDIIGLDAAEILRDISIELYNYGEQYLNKKGIILADTKFEFGEDENGNYILIDEAMTPDSSRFWLKEEYAPGKKQVNFDKQVLRDYLETLDWNKQAPPPDLPDEIINKTLEKYKEAEKRILS